MLRSTWRGLETWHGRDGVTLADERARQQGTQTSTYTGAPDPDPTWERPEVKFLWATRQTRPSCRCADNGRSALSCGHGVAAQRIGEECHLQSLDCLEASGPSCQQNNDSVCIPHIGDVFEGFKFDGNGLRLLLGFVEDDGHGKLELFRRAG